MRLSSALRRHAPTVLIALGAAIGATVVLVNTRDLGFLGGDWRLLTGPASPDALDGDPALVAVLCYRALRAIAGLGDAWPYRAAVVLAHCLCGVLLWRLAGRRVGAWLALVPALALLGLPAFTPNVLLDARLGALLSIVAGLTALLCLDHDDPPSDLWAMLWLTLAVLCSLTGFAFVLAAAVEVGWGRGRPRRGWIVLAPLAVELVWLIGYATVDATVAIILAVGIGAVFAIGASGAGDRLSPRSAGALAAALGLPLLARLVDGAGERADQWEYAAIALVTIAALPRLSWRRLPRLAYGAIAASLAALAVYDAIAFASAADDRQAEDERLRVAISGLLIAGAGAPANFAPEPELASGLTAGGLRDLQRGGQSPPAGLERDVASAPEATQRRLDALLERAEGLGPRPVAVPPASIKRPLVVLARSGKRDLPASGCERITSKGTPVRIVVRPERSQSVVLYVPSGSGTTVRLRRFATAFGARSNAGDKPGASLIALRRDASARRWHVAVTTRTTVRLCATRGRR